VLLPGVTVCASAWAGLDERYKPPFHSPDQALMRRNARLRESVRVTGDLEHGASRPQPPNPT